MAQGMLGLELQDWRQLATAVGVSLWRPDPGKRNPGAGYEIRAERLMGESEGRTTKIVAWASVGFGPFPWPERGYIRGVGRIGAWAKYTLTDDVKWRSERSESALRECTARQEFPNSEEGILGAEKYVAAARRVVGYLVVTDLSRFGSLRQFRSATHRARGRAFGELEIESLIRAEA